MYLFINPVFFTCGLGAEFGNFKPEGDLFGTVETYLEIYD